MEKKGRRFCLGLPALRMNMPPRIVPRARRTRVFFNPEWGCVRKKTEKTMARLKKAPSDLVSKSANARGNKDRILFWGLKVSGKIMAKYPPRTAGVGKGKKTLRSAIFSKTKGSTIFASRM